MRRAGKLVWVPFLLSFSLACGGAPPAEEPETASEAQAMGGSTPCDTCVLSPPPVRPGAGTVEMTGGTSCDTCAVEAMVPGQPDLKQHETGTGPCDVCAMTAAPAPSSPKVEEAGGVHCDTCTR
jgi:hypothetical protein